MSWTSPRWARRRIGDVLKIRYGKSLDKSLRNEAGVVPVVGSAGRMTGTSVALVDGPAVIIGRKGNAGRVLLELQGCWPIDTTYFAEIPEMFDARFLRWQLHALELGKLDSSTTTPSLRRETLEAQDLAVPPLDEQRRIVAILEEHLSRLATGEQSLDRVAKRLRAFRESQLHSAVAHARLSPSMSLTTVGALSTVRSGTTPLKGNEAFYKGGSIPWVTSGDLHQGSVTQATHFVTAKAVEETSLRILPAGSLLVAMYGEGKTRGTAAELTIDATINQACAAIILHDQQIRPWVRLVLDANYGALRKSAAGGVQPNLNLSIVRSIEIPIPAERVRIALVKQTSEMAEEQSRLQAEIDRARGRSAALGRSVLAAAFSGRLTGADSRA